MGRNPEYMEKETSQDTFRATPRPPLLMAFGSLENGANEQAHGVFMEKGRTPGEHYFKIKILHQHRLTFPTWIPALAARIPVNL